MSFDLPIVLNTARLHALVVGGGAVGQRRSRMLLSAGVAVRVVALEAQPQDVPYSVGFEWLREPYRADHLDGVRLVYTAAPREVSEMVHRDAHARGLLVCRADDATLGDFITPTVIARGRRLRIAVSTGGASPFLARRVADRLAEQFDETFGQWVDLLDAERARAEAASWEPPAGRQTFLECISDWSWLDRFRADGEAAVVGAYQELARQLGRHDPAV